ncbi:MAG: hypothetical protein KBC73_19180 [Burkholderiaceae bacterium]|nr:hypothetical protein [Burkholderiaceae bacterium]
MNATTCTPTPADPANPADPTGRASDLAAAAISAARAPFEPPSPSPATAVARPGVTEAFIAGAGYALPHRVSQRRFLDQDEAVRRKLGQSERTLRLARQVGENSGILYRHFTQACWLPEHERPAGEPDIFTGHDFNPPGWKRALEWQRVAPALALRAAREALAQWGGDRGEITHVITTCTSGWSEPGISCELIHELGLSLDTAKQELNFNGCFCGMTCLRLARDLIRGGEARNVLVVAVETASVQYDPQVQSPSQLIASSLFADGAAAFVVGREGAWQFEAAGMSLVPDSRDLLRMSPDVEGPSDTYRMFLDRRVGARLAQYFDAQRGSQLLDQLLQRCGHHPTLAVHPGGPAILESVDAVFQRRGWPADALAPSFEALNHTGNLGAAAMPYVLARLLPTLSGDRHVALLAFGPGVTVEWGLLRPA